MKELMESSYLSVMGNQNDKLREENQHLQNQVEKLTQENNDLEEKYIRERDKSIKLTLKLSDLEEENEQVQNTNMQLATLNTNLRSTRDLYKSVIDKALKNIENQKVKMYKSRNKIAMYILIKLEKILRSKE